MNIIFIIIIIIIFVIIYCKHNTENFMSTSTQIDKLFSYSLKTNDGKKLHLYNTNTFLTYELPINDMSGTFIFGIKQNDGNAYILTMPEINKYVLGPKVINKQQRNTIRDIIYYIYDKKMIDANINGVRYHLKMDSVGNLEWITNINLATEFILTKSI